MEWKEYEEVTKNIYEKLGAESGVTIECFGRNCKVIGKSEVEHQVDVLTKFSDGIHTYKTAVECKYWNENVNKDTVMKVASIVSDAGLTKGVIVSKVGFTTDAIKYAGSANIGLVELREPTQEDWEGRIKKINIGVEVYAPTTSVFQIIVSNASDPELPAWPANSELLEILFENGEIRQVSSLEQEFHNELNEKETPVETEKIFNFEENTKLRNKSNNEVIEIKGIRFIGYLRILKRNIELNGEDYVFMVMKNIFDKRSFVISKDGQIGERDY